MPKKDDGSSKKADKKKKEQRLNDLTFGLKNKNKSAKVQAAVQSIHKSVMNSGDQKARAEQDKMKRLKEGKKAAAAAAAAERDALFGEALLAVKKKNDAKEKGGAIGRDGGDDGK
jgi:hypothetical protein